MNTMVDGLIGAWALDFVAYGDFKLDSFEIFENKACSSGDSYKIEFFHFSKKMFGEEFHIRLFFGFIFFTFFFGRVHFLINIIEM